MSARLELVVWDGCSICDGVGSNFFGNGDVGAPLLAIFGFGAPPLGTEKVLGVELLLCPGVDEFDTGGVCRLRD